MSPADARHVAADLTPIPLDAYTGATIAATLAYTPFQLAAAAEWLLVMTGHAPAYPGDLVEAMDFAYPGGMAAFLTAHDL